MKNGLLCTLFSLLFCACTNVVSSNTDIDLVTLFSSKPETQNSAWVGTFQLAFNDMKDKVLKLDKIEFANEKPTDELIGLNKEEFNSSMLNESSYYTSYGLVLPAAKEKIKKDIKEKFSENSDVVDGMDWTPAPGKHYAYAMLKKQFEFLEAFDKLSKASFNNSSEVYDYFGINENSNEALNKNLKVLFYNNKDDYAVSLLTKNGDIIYLYRTDENNDFKTLYEKMLNKKENYKGSTKFNDTDTFKAPNLKIKTIRNYEELINKTIKNTSHYFSKALETIELELDNKGGKVKSEAIIIQEDTVAANIEPVIAPRHFNFDKPFVMFLIDSGKDDPYLALRLENLTQIGTNK